MNTYDILHIFSFLVYILAAIAVIGILAYLLFNFDIVNWVNINTLNNSTFSIILYTILLASLIFLLAELIYYYSFNTY